MKQVFVSIHLTFYMTNPLMKIILWLLAFVPRKRNGTYIWEVWINTIFFKFLHSLQNIQLTVDSMMAWRCSAISNIDLNGYDFCLLTKTTCCPDRETSYTVIRIKLWFLLMLFFFIEKNVGYANNKVVKSCKNTNIWI